LDNTVIIHADIARSSNLLHQQRICTKEKTQKIIIYLLVFYAKLIYSLIREL
jgi:hypothetical protein